MASRKHRAPAVARDFELRADEYAQRSSWVEDPEVLAPALELLGERPLGAVLDAGGGTGSLISGLTAKLPWSRGLVFDASESMLLKVPERFETQVGDLEADELRASYDTILLRQVLHYLENPEAVLERLRHHARPGARLYVGQIVAPDREAAEWLSNLTRMVSPNRRKIWTADELRLLFGNCGYSLEGMKLSPFDDDVDALLRRRVVEVDCGDVRRLARDSATPAVVSSMHLDLGSERIPYRVLWCHALLAVPGVRS
jgi:SAM-dependent methyltransferase